VGAEEGGARRRLPPRLRLGSRSRALEAAATGAWLGLSQVALGFALLSGVGASAALFFALIGAWLAGGVAGASAPGGGDRARAALLGAALVAVVTARWALSRWPFSGGTAWVGLAAGALAGAYAARFLRDRAVEGWDARALLRDENNGFVAGFVAAGGLLFVSAQALDGAVIAGGLALLGWSLRHDAARLARVLGQRRRDLVLFLAGHNLILLNYVLIRQMTVSLADLETAALLTALAYFSGVSLGYLRPERVTSARLPRLLPLFLVLQLAMAVLGPLIARAVARHAGPSAAYAAVFALVAIGSTSLYAVLLPNAVGPDEGSTARCYSAEILGSLAGILALAALSRGGPLPVHAAYLAALLAIAALLGVRRLPLAAMAALAAGFLIAYGALDRRVSEAIYRAELNDGRPLRVLAARTSPYQKIEVIEAEGRGRLLVLDGRLHFEPAWHDDYSYFAAEYPARLLGRPDVCVLGCGSMSAVGRIGEGAASIHIVDLDERVFEVSRAFFGEWNRLSALSGWSFEADDAKHFLATTSRSFDLIVDDIPPARTRQIALTYTREFFALVRQRLRPRGLFSLPTLVPVTSRRSAYGLRILATMASVFDRVAVLTVHGASYCFAMGPGLALDEETLRTAIDHPDAPAVRILTSDEVARRVAGVPIITMNNMADLMEE
jgi:spermidine synthase